MRAETYSRQGLDIVGRFRGVAKRLPQSLDCIVNTVIEVYEGVGRPNILPQFLAGDDFARALQENLQNLEWLFLQPDLDSLPAQFSGIFIQLKSPEADVPL